MVIAAHPDDADFGPAATAALWIDAGSEGWLVCCTSGDQGGEDPDMDPLELAAIREREQRAAADVVGYAGVTFLHAPDGALANEKRIPNIPIFVDSPLAVDVTSVHRDHPECFDEQTREYLMAGGDPFGFQRLQYIRESDPAKRKELLETMHRRLWEVVPYLPLGQFVQPFLWRSNITGVLRTNVLAFWNISKA